MWLTGMRIHEVNLYAGLTRAVSVGLLCLMLVACAGRSATEGPDASQASSDAALVGGSQATTRSSALRLATAAPTETSAETSAEVPAAILPEDLAGQQSNANALNPPAMAKEPIGPPEPTAQERKSAKKRAKADINHPEDEHMDAELMAASETGPPDRLRPPPDPCAQFDAEYPSWIDRNQVRVYRTVCSTAAWFDGFFGDNRYDPETGDTYGRITAGAFWDEKDSWQSRVRFRARFALPSVRERGSLLIGRGSEEELIEERGEAGSTTVQQTLANEPDSTFVGYGFDRLNSLTRGLRFSAGLRLSTPVRLYGKIRYRREWQFTERDIFRLRPLLYWKSEEGLGATMAFDIDHIVSKTMLLRTSNFANASEDEEIEGINWGSNLYLFQFLSNKRAITYSAFVTGETKAEVGVQNGGLELRYRQRILRDWLFIELITGVNWPREFLEETREANFGAGLLLEAYFGPAPADWVR